LFLVKNASLILNVVLAVAVAYLYYLQFGNKTVATTAGADSTAVEPARKVVYVNVDSLLSKYELYKDTQKVLESKGFQLDNDLNAKGRSLQNEIAFFQQRAQTMTMEQARATEAALQKKQQDFVAYREQSAQRLAAEQQKKLEEVYNAIQAYIKEVNKNNQYEYVLGYTRGGGILFADPKLDQTSQLVAGLNKAYQEKQAAPKK